MLARQPANLRKDVLCSKYSAYTATSVQARLVPPCDGRRSRRPGVSAIMPAQYATWPHVKQEESPVPLSINMRPLQRGHGSFGDFSSIGGISLIASRAALPFSDVLLSHYTMAKANVVRTRYVYRLHLIAPYTAALVCSTLVSTRSGAFKVAGHPHRASPSLRSQAFRSLQT